MRLWRVVVLVSRSDGEEMTRVSTPGNTLQHTAMATFTQILFDGEGEPVATWGCMFCN